MFTSIFIKLRLHAFSLESGNGSPEEILFIRHFILAKIELFQRTK